MTSAQDDIDQTKRQVGQDAEVLGGGVENGHFTYVTGRKVNDPVQPANERYIVSNIYVEFDNGKSVKLNTDKVMLVDRLTGKPIFDYVLEGK